MQTNRFGPGDSPVVTVRANNILVEDGAAIAVFNAFEGPGGHISVEGGHVELVGTGTPGGVVGGTGILAQGVFHPCFGCELEPGVFDVDPALTNGESGSIEIHVTGEDSLIDRKSTRLNSSHSQQSRMPSSA